MMSISSYISLNKPSRHFDTLTTIISSSSKMVSKQTSLWRLSPSPSFPVSQTPLQLIEFACWTAGQDASWSATMCASVKCWKSSFPSVKVSGGFKFQPFSAHWWKRSGPLWRTSRLLWTFYLFFTGFHSFTGGLWISSNDISCQNISVKLLFHQLPCICVAHSDGILDGGSRQFLRILEGKREVLTLHGNIQQSSTSLRW